MNEAKILNNIVRLLERASAKQLRIIYMVAFAIIKKV